MSASSTHQLHKPYSLASNWQKCRDNVYTYIQCDMLAIGNLFSALRILASVLSSVCVCVCVCACVRVCVCVCVSTCSLFVEKPHKASGIYGKPCGRAARGPCSWPILSLPLISTFSHHFCFCLCEIAAASHG